MGFYVCKGNLGGSCFGMLVPDCNYLWVATTITHDYCNEAKLNRCHRSTKHVPFSLSSIAMINSLFPRCVCSYSDMVVHIGALVGNVRQASVYLS